MSKSIYRDAENADTYFVCQCSMCEPLTGFCHSDPIQGCREHGHQGQLEGSVCMSMFPAKTLESTMRLWACYALQLPSTSWSWRWQVRRVFICSPPMMEVASETIWRPWWKGWRWWCQGLCLVLRMHSKTPIVYCYDYHCSMTRTGGRGGGEWLDEAETLEKGSRCSKMNNHQFLFLDVSKSTSCGWGQFHWESFSCHSGSAARRAGASSWTWQESGLKFVNSLWFLLPKQHGSTLTNENERGTSENMELW